MNQDTVANLFDFPAREYKGIHGRWPSPGPAGIHSVRMKDPQTFDRHAYVRNSPLSRLDPLGLESFPASPTCSDGDDEDETCAGDNSAGGDGDVFSTLFPFGGDYP